jgi:hypothetical protein
LAGIDLHSGHAFALAKARHRSRGFIALFRSIDAYSFHPKPSLSAPLQRDDTFFRLLGDGVKVSREYPVKKARSRKMNSGRSGRFAKILASIVLAALSAAAPAAWQTIAVEQ